MDFKCLIRKKEDLVCSFESAKKLKENNIKLDTLFSWLQREHNDSVQLVYREDVKRYTALIVGEWFSAPTTGELDHILHTFGFAVVVTDSQPYDPEDIPEEGFWYDLISLEGKWDFTLSLIDKSSADAKVDALIWLVEEGIIQGKGCNDY